VPSERVRDLIARACIGVLFTLLSISLLEDFLKTGRVTGLLLLAGESLVVVLTIVRRRARIVDRSVGAAVATTVALVGPPLLRPGDLAGLLPDPVTAAVSAFGLILVIVGKMALGRSFGVVPANRGVVMRGPYGIVRHPIYTGYLINYTGFVLANPNAWNILVILVTVSALVVRALMEEKILQSDAAYQVYCRKVGWHLVPGVF
jgi:protein-S-isoprenylcysteine O-methyltransferase Ste14